LPATLQDTGLSDSFVDGLICKYLLGVYAATGRQVASVLGLPFSIIDKAITSLRSRKMVVNTDVASFGDFTIQLSEEGQRQAVRWMEACSYVGTAPVPLADYVAAIREQTLKHDNVGRGEISRSFDSISIREGMLQRIGPAIRAGSGLFLHGAPGNGKTTIAERIGNAFEQTIWIPKTLVVDGNIILLYDPAYHRAVKEGETASVLRDQAHDERWIEIRRPTVVAGGELTLESLELRHDHVTNISSAPLQLKANGGVLVIDDFGRQRIAPADLLNRWIVPLDRKYDLLTLFTGKRIEVPFELLVVFSTNLDPSDLVDEAFLRRIPYKIHVPDPGEEEFCEIFRLVAQSHGIAFDHDAVDALLDKHYREPGRPLRRCHPRDLLLHLINFCDYQEQPRELSGAILDRVARDYFLHGPGIHVEGS
jgi:hypothetical protein